MCHTIASLLKEGQSYGVLWLRQSYHVCMESPGSKRTVGRQPRVWVHRNLPRCAALAVSPIANLRAMGPQNPYYPAVDVRTPNPKELVA